MEEEGSFNDKTLHEKSMSCDYYYYQRHNIPEISVYWRYEEMKRGHDENILKFEGQSPPFGKLDFIGLKRYRFDELKEITKNFSEENLIQPTGLGRLFRGQIQQGSETKMVTVKTWDFRMPLKEIYYSSLIKFYDEIMLLTTNSRLDANLDSKLLNVNGICVEKMLAAVYDQEFKKSLADAFCSDDFNWQRRMGVAYSAAQLLDSFHERLMVLCRFRSKSIMIDEDDRIKLVDLGHFQYVKDLDEIVYISKVFNRTHDYAPEIGSGPWFSAKSDVYSFGIFILEMIAKRDCSDFLSFHDWSMEEVFIPYVSKNKSLVHESLNVDPVISKEITELAIRCLQENPRDRPTMKQVCADLKKLAGIKREPLDARRRIQEAGLKFLLI